MVVPNVYQSLMQLIEFWFFYDDLSDPYAFKIAASLVSLVASLAVYILPALIVVWICYSCLRLFDRWY